MCEDFTVKTLWLVIYLSAGLASLNAQRAV